MANGWFERFVEKQFVHTHHILEKILANQEELGAAIAALQNTDATLVTAVSAYSTLVQKVNADLVALEAKVASGASLDLSAEVAAIRSESAANAAQVASIIAGNASLATADANANPAPADVTSSAPSAETTSAPAPETATAETSPATV